VEVDAEMVHRLQVGLVDGEGAAVGVDGLLVAAHLVEGEADVEEPAAVVGVDVGGGAEFLQRLRPAALLEQLLGLFHPSLGVIPLGHTPIRRLSTAPRGRPCTWRQTTCKERTDLNY